MGDSHEDTKARSGRRWRPRQLDRAPDDSREWLIWSRYWRAWHCRSSSGGAAGYTTDILCAGIFETRKAREYHCGIRDRAVHITKQAAKLREAARQMRARHDAEQRELEEKLEFLRGFVASCEPESGGV
jgi:hypothetical protein